MKSIKIKYPNRLREFRLKAGLTQEGLAKKMLFNNSQNRISKWEKGIGLPNLPNLMKLARFYQVSPQELYPEL